MGAAEPSPSATESAPILRRRGGWPRGWPVDLRAAGAGGLIRHV